MDGKNCKRKKCSCSKNTCWDGFNSFFSFFGNAYVPTIFCLTTWVVIMVNGREFFRFFLHLQPCFFSTLVKVKVLMVCWHVSGLLLYNETKRKRKEKQKTRNLEWFFFSLDST